MKSMILSVFLLCSPLAQATLSNDVHVSYALNDEHEAVVGEDSQLEQAKEEAQGEQQDEVDFDALMNDENVPEDMIPAAKPVSACEAYLKEIGITLFMQYIAFKIWLEHQWKSCSKSA